MLPRLLNFIYNHPLNSDNKIGGVLDFIKWQIAARLNPFPILYPYTENSKFIIWKGLTGATGNLYCGLMEYADMGFLLHFLRPTDLFVDIGANVGAYTILASGEIKSETIAIEPVPSTFKNLVDNIVVNKMEQRVTAHNIGLGSADGVLRFTRSFDTINHVATEGEKDTIDVPVSTLDAIPGSACPMLVKIDVEGFETEVLRGAGKVLANQDLKAIIIELNGSGERYGYKEDDIHHTFLKLGFGPYTYEPKTRALKRLSTYGNHNTIYIRDTDYVEDRLRQARKVKVGRRNAVL